MNKCDPEAGISLSWVNDPNLSAVCIIQFNVFFPSLQSNYGCQWVEFFYCIKFITAKTSSICIKDYLCRDALLADWW